MLLMINCAKTCSVFICDVIKNQINVFQNTRIIPQTERNILHHYPPPDATLSLHLLWSFCTISNGICVL